MMKIEEASSKLAEGDWLTHVNSWKASQLSAAAYCRTHQLSISRFKYWHYKLIPSDKKRKQPAVNFAQVISSVPPVLKEVDVIVEVNKYRLILHSPLNTALVNNVIDVLEQRS